MRISHNRNSGRIAISGKYVLGTLLYGFKDLTMQLVFEPFKPFISYFRFVKRINEAWKDTPIAVHCSAGVGRSGTLIAIDSLLQQLEEEGEVNIYQTVCELRRNRNYLVQSVVSNSLVR